MLERGNPTVCPSEARVRHHRSAHARPAPRPARIVPAVLSVLILGLTGATPSRAGDLRVDGSFVSTAPTGTPPLDVASTTRVDDLNADLLDGQDASAFAPAPAQVLWVSPSGGQFTSIQAALDEIKDASINKPYLVHVGPGRYFEQVTMKPWVDIEGSGSGVTSIRGFGGSTVEGASNAELRDLTVENAAGTDYGKAIYNFGAAPRITRVKVIATSTSGTAIGILNDASAIAPQPILRQVEVVVHGPDAIGIKNDEVSALLTDVQVSATGSDSIGIFNHDASPVLRRVQVAAKAQVSGESKIIGILNSGDDGLGSPRLVDVTVTASNGDLTYAISNGSNLLDIEMTRVEANAYSASGSSSIAVRNFDSNVYMADCTATASAFGSGNVSRAVWNNRSPLYIIRSVLSAGGTGQNYGLRNNDTSGGTDGGPWRVEVRQSRIYATTAAVSSSSSFITSIAATSLEVGSVSSAGTLTCAGVYDENFTFYPDTCP